MIEAEKISEVVADRILIGDVKVSAYIIPTATPESDGTLEWDSTTLIFIEIFAGGKKGLGYSYANIAAATIIKSVLLPVLKNENCLDIPALTQKMFEVVRNDGQCGIAAMAISAVDNALWDLKAKCLDVPLCNLLGKAKNKILLYGSGGFTSYSEKQTRQQFEGWAAQGIKHFKMKVGRQPEMDVERVRAAREAIGNKAHLFVDANGAYTIKQAVEKANQFAAYNVSWFEEPVASDNLNGLHFIKTHCPPEVNIAAGEYGWNLPYFKNMLDAAAVDILQADATRCGGITNFLKVAGLCEAEHLPFSSHCAPSIHLHPALSISSFYISEYFYDHVRIEAILFDGVPQVIEGCLQPDLSRPGNGLEFKSKDAKQFQI